MSQYLDPKFLQPQVDQYGSHMVMTNVVKPSKHKQIHLDTKFRDETTSAGSLIDVNFTLPDRITNVRSAKVIGAELPFTFYNLQYQDCATNPTTNNCFSIAIKSNQTGWPDNTVGDTIVIPPAHITPASLCTAINNALKLKFITTYENGFGDPQQSNVNNYLRIDYAADINQYYFVLSAGFEVVIDFMVNSEGISDSLNVKNKLGWVMGFRTLTKTMNNTNPFGPLLGSSVDYADQEFYSDQPSTNFPYPKYFYVVLEDYSRTPNNSVITPLAKAYNIPKNIIAKVMCDTSVGKGNTIFCSASNGLLISDTRMYGKTDLQRFRVQLVDDEGIVIDLNGGELSLTLEIEHE